MEISKQPDVAFTFVATEQISQDRLEMGYADMNKAYGFVLRTYEGGNALREAEDLARNCDVMIFGSAPISYLKSRMSLNKLTFYFTERVLRKGYWRRFIPTTYKKILDGYVRYKDQPLYILGASAYTSYDLKLCGFNAKKCFKWGYFPEIEQNEIETLLKKKRNNEKVEILYAGRLLQLKNVLDTVKALRLLVQQKITNFHFTIVGDGEQKPAIEAYIKKHALHDYVSILPFVPAEQVREYMDQANVYVFGSNFFEGWGAVVNEAMNSACAMVVSHSVGAAPYLIDHGKNGLIYECSNITQLAECLSRLITNPAYREKLATEAHLTITNEWAPSIAAERVVKLAKALMEDFENVNIYKSGVCSLAKPIKNNWAKKTLRGDKNVTFYK